MNNPVQYKIDVTQDDIDNGIPGSVCDCAIARAGKRVFQNKSIMVNGKMFIGGAPDYMSFSLPKEVWHFISNFDNDVTRHTCKPFSFMVG